MEGGNHSCFELSSEPGRISLSTREQGCGVRQEGWSAQAGPAATGAKLATHGGCVSAPLNFGAATPNHRWRLGWHTRPASDPGVVTPSSCLGETSCRRCVTFCLISYIYHKLYYISYNSKLNHISTIGSLLLVNSHFLLGVLGRSSAVFRHFLLVLQAMRGRVPGYMGMIVSQKKCGWNRNEWNACFKRW